MLHVFRRHVAGCVHHKKRTGQKCPSQPPCPIHYEGVDGRGKRVRSQGLIDPRTGNGVRDWSRGCEIVRDMEAPETKLEAEVRTPISEATGHFLKLKATKSRDTLKKSERLLEKFSTFMEAAPRRYQFMTEIKFPDLTDLCSTWTGANRTKIRDLGILTSFLKYCNRADFTPKNIGEGLFKTMHWPDDKGQREPFTAAELEAIWEVLPNLPDEYGRLGQPIAKQTEAFVYLMRYTGMDVSTTMSLPKAHVRENTILTYRLKNGAEVWTVFPEWVIDKLQAAPHDSEAYFFWSGQGNKHTRASTIPNVTPPYTPGNSDLLNANTATCFSNSPGGTTGSIVIPCGYTDSFGTSYPSASRSRRITRPPTSCWTSTIHWPRSTLPQRRRCRVPRSASVTSRTAS